VIGLDTNILVRHLTQDDPDQSPRASAAIAEACSLDDPGFVNRIVLCELVRVLTRAYRYDRATIATCIEALLDSSDLRIGNEEEARTALSRFRDGHDFPDAFVALTNLRRGCEATLTFDAAATRMPEFRAPRL
jgi:predicted nucleic-acid-binding protein